MRNRRLERKRKGFTLQWMKGWPCIYRFTMPVLNNAVSDVIFAIFSDTISLRKLESHETEKAKEREKDVRPHLNYIDSFLFALYNQSLEYMLLFLSRSPRYRNWKRILKEMRKGRRARVKDRLVTVSHNRRLEMRFDSGNFFFCKSLYCDALKKLSADICIKRSRSF